MEFSRLEYWSGKPLLSPGDLPNPRTEPRSPTLQADSLLSEAPGKPHITFNYDNKPYEESTSIPILQILKLSFRKVI